MRTTETCTLTASLRQIAEAATEAGVEVSLDLPSGNPHYGVTPSPWVDHKSLTPPRVAISREILDFPR